MEQILSYKEKGIKKIKNLVFLNLKYYIEKQVISSLFFQEEMEKLQDLFMEKYNGESKLEIFLNKINELEKGNNIENIELNMLNDECTEMEKQIRELEGLLRIH